MDYEKKYKEALERAKCIKNGMIKLEEGDSVIDCIFPELVDSEDELAWLTKYVEEEAYSLSMDIRDNEDRIKLKKIQRSLAWLEKQKKLEKETTIAWHDVSEEPQEMRELFCEWESDDATWHDVCFYDSKTNKFRQNKMPIDNVTKWTYVDELLELQKTVEWSEEDEIHRQWILECLADGKRKVPEYSEQYQSLFDWFESLKQRIGG